MNVPTNEGAEKLPPCLLDAISEAMSHGNAVRTLTFSPDLCRAILTVFPFEEQRKLSEPHVSDLAGMMSSGLWGGISGSNIRLGIVNRRVYLYGGQHRIHAIIKAGVPITARVEIDTFGSYSQLVDDYLKTHSHKPLALRESLKIAGTNDALEIPTEHVSCATSSILFISANFTGNDTKLYRLLRSSPTLLDSVMRGWSAPIRAYSLLLEEAPNLERRGWLRRAFMSLGLVTLRFDTENAMRFWGDAMRNDGLARDSPTWAAHLTAVTPDTRGGRFSLDAFIRLVRCWNAFKDGRESIKVVRGVIGGDKSFYVHGTPYKQNTLPDPGAILGVTNTSGVEAGPL